MSESRLVYSTDVGDRREKERGRPAGQSRTPQIPDDGLVRVFRDNSGRRGKTVTLVRGLVPAELAAVASDLKRHCGTGGSVKDGAIELQGDHREKVAARLESQGHRVKLAGG